LFKVWLAPEMLRGDEFSYKADTYAYGIILWEMVTRDHFFGNEDFMSVIQAKILDGVRPDIPEGNPPELTQLIKVCWQNDPGKQVSITLHIAKSNRDIGIYRQ